MYLILTLVSHKLQSSFRSAFSKCTTLSIDEPSSKASKMKLPNWPV